MLDEGRGSLSLAGGSGAHSQPISANQTGETADFRPAGFLSRLQPSCFGNTLLDKVAGLRSTHVLTTLDRASGLLMPHSLVACSP